jgi:hypothetical protein
MVLLIAAGVAALVGMFTLLWAIALSDWKSAGLSALALLVAAPMAALTLFANC